MQLSIVSANRKYIYRSISNKVENKNLENSFNKWGNIFCIHFAISPDSRGVWAAQVRLELIWLGRAMSHVYCAMCQMRTWAKNKDKRTKDMSVDWDGGGGEWKL